MSITYRFLSSLEDYKACLKLQKEVWEFDDIDIVPIPLLVIAKENGGFLYGAFDEEKLIGFVYSIIGLKNNEIIHCSHMLAVLPEYRDKGIGYYLKLKQREYALHQSIKLITWTFDPFQLKNAFFNIEKLGIIVREYKENIYGETTSPLHYGLPTDRMLAEWYIDSERVQNIIQKKTQKRKINFEEAIIYNLTDEISFPIKKAEDILIEVPGDFKVIADSDKDSAMKIIERARILFKYFFSNNYIIERFLIRRDESIHYYYYMHPYLKDVY